MHYSVEECFEKILQGSLIVFQHPFDISTILQNENIIWFNNMSLVKVLQGSLMVLQHHFDICTTIQNEKMLGSIT